MKNGRNLPGILFPETETDQNMTGVMPVI